MRRRFLSVLAALLGLALSGTEGAEFSARIKVELVSINHRGDATANHSSGARSMSSANGRFILFSTLASDVTTVPDPHFQPDLFLRDRATGQTELITINRTGTAAAVGSTRAPSGRLTRNGRFLVFASDKAELVQASDGNRVDDVFFREIDAHTNTLISVDREGGAAGGFDPWATEDGRYVYFSSRGENLVPNDVNGQGVDVFRRDRQTSSTVLVSPDKVLLQLSRDGRFLLMQAEGNGHVYLHDTASQITTLVTPSAGGVPNGRIEAAQMSEDGRFVVFHSEATNLGPADPSFFRDVYIRDVAAGTTRRLDTPSNREATLGDISEDGRIIAFFVQGQGLPNMFVHDQQAGTTQQTTAALSGGLDLDPTGRFIVFESGTSGLTPNDSSHQLDVFMHDRYTGTTVLISRALTGDRGGDEASEIRNAARPIVTDDAQTVVFMSWSRNLVATPKWSTAAGYVDVYTADIEPSGRMLNISTRAFVGVGDSALIGGFFVTGREPKKIAVRAIGPSLGAAGVEGSLADPSLELFDANGISLGANDSWRENQQEIQGAGLAPQDDREAALVRSFEPGAYTAVVRGQHGSTGVALVEAYDLSQSADSRLANISTRGLVGTGGDVMIGGFIAGGGGGGGTKILVRAIGPTLSGSGVQNALGDPTLELRDGNGVLIIANDNWREAQEQEIAATGIPPSDDREAAIITTLGSGPHTTIVRDRNDLTGVGLVELYNLN